MTIEGIEDVDILEEKEMVAVQCKYYAKTEYSEKYGRWVLKKSNAGKKDQSYVLWNYSKRIN